MKNKKLFGLTALCCTSMLLFACNNNKKPQPHGPTLYTVTFYNGEEVWDIRQAEAGDVVDAPANNPTKLDHDFLGWYTELEAGVKWVFETDVVNNDMSLYAHFEASQIDYTVNLLLNDAVITTKTTNSHDQNDVTLSPIAVEEGKSLLGYGAAAGTTATDVDYRIDSVLTYDEIVALANDQHVVNLHAIVKTGAMLRLNVALWERYADEDCANRIIGAFKTYADVHSIAYDFLDIKEFASAASDDPYYSVNDLAPACVQDEEINVVFPTGENFKTKYDAAAVATESTKTVLEHELLGVQIKNARGTSTSDANRYVSRLTNDAVAAAFMTWLLSDDGKVVLDPDYTPTPETQMVLTISFYGRYISDTNAGKIVDEIKRYFTASDIEYTNVIKDYVTADDGPDNDSYAAAILSTSDMSIGGGAIATLNTAFENNGFTIAKKENLGTIAEQTKRYAHTFNTGELTEACLAYLLSPTGQEFLGTLTA